MDPVRATVTIVGVVLAPYQVIKACNDIIGLIDSVHHGYETQKETVDLIKKSIETILSFSSSGAQVDKNLEDICIDTQKKLDQLYVRLRTENWFKRRLVWYDVKKDTASLERHCRALERIQGGLTLQAVMDITANLGIKTPSLLTAERKTADIQDRVNKMTVRDMTNEGIYEKPPTFRALDGNTTTVYQGVRYLVEGIPCGSDMNETKSRRRRLVTLILAFREAEDEYIVRPTKLVEYRSDFYLLSSTRFEKRLKDVISTNAVKRNISIMINVACAVQEIHDCHLAHKNINSFSVLADENGNTGLSGFISSRMLSASSDNAYNLSDVESRRVTELYQAPERRGPNRASYALSCDIYSLGMLMYEIHEGICIFNDSAIKNGDYVTAKLRDLPEQTNSILGLIRACMGGDATERPNINRVLEWLDCYKKLQEQELHT